MKAAISLIVILGLIFPPSLSVAIKLRLLDAWNENVYGGMFSWTEEDDSICCCYSWSEPWTCLPQRGLVGKWLICESLSISRPK